MIYLYALADTVRAIEEVTGVAGEPLRLIAMGDIVAVAGECPSLPALTAQSLARQDRVVRELQARATALLPVRFGAGFPSDEAALQAVQARAAALRARLDLVRGREQMTLWVLSRVTPVTEAEARARQTVTRAPSGEAGGKSPSRAAAPQPHERRAGGAAYLAARAARARPPEIVPLLEALGPLTRSTRIEPGRTPGVVATVYHLIERGSSDAYRARIAEMQSRSARLSALVIRIAGPSPCYAFA